MPSTPSGSKRLPTSDNAIISILYNFWTKHSLERSSSRLLQRVKLAHFNRRNCYQLLCDVTGMPDISFTFILLWSFRFLECIIIWIILKKYAPSQNNMKGSICAIPECNSKHEKHVKFEIFLNSPKFSEIFLESFRSAYYSESSKILP